MNAKQARELSGFSQNELARKVEMTPVTIHLIETGKVLPRHSTRRRIEGVLGKVDWLEERLKQPIRTTGFVENESEADQLLKDVKRFLCSVQGHEVRMDRIQFAKEELKR